MESRPLAIPLPPSLEMICYQVGNFIPMHHKYDIASEPLMINTS